ncbi:MAG: hypothetical protein Q8P73_01210 [bacterium]|nr:hypothetical protein [bacterium]
MRKIVVLQSPAKLYEVVPVFYKELNKANYFDEFYLATDKKEPHGLGGNVKVINLEKDLGWEANLKILLENIPEDIFVMMCDDHVTVGEQKVELDKYFEVMKQAPELGRLQLSPPTRNYYKFLKVRGLPVVIPDDKKGWYPYDKRYRWHLNFQPSIWRKDFLSEVIEGGGNRSQMEIRAAERARRSKRYVSGYIGSYALRYENFLASCQVDHIDFTHHRKKKTSVYREEFIRYAKRNNYQLDSNKMAYIRQAGLQALMPSKYAVDHFGDREAYKKYAIKRSSLAYRWSRLKRRLRARIAPFISVSGR